MGKICLPSSLLAYFSLLAIVHPLIMANISKPSVPHSCMPIAAPTIIQRAGLSDGMPIGSSGSMPVSRETLRMYASVLFSLAGAHFETMPRMVYSRYLW